MTSVQSDGFGYLGQFPTGQYPNVSGHILQTLWDPIVGQMFFCDGATWRPLSSIRTIVTGGIPVGAPSSGTMGANGALTLTTGFAFTFPNCYLYFPAGKVFTGSPAGQYFTKMASATQGIVYNVMYVNGTPAIPTTLVAVSDAGPGAYTQTTGAPLPLTNFIVPGNSMGINGQVRFRQLTSYDNSAGTKQPSCTWGGVQFFQPAASSTTLSFEWVRTITNSGVPNLQYSESLTTVQYGGAAVNSAVQPFSADTSQDTPLATTVQLNTATDFFLVVNSTLEVLYSA